MAYGHIYQRKQVHQDALGNLRSLEQMQIFARLGTWTLLNSRRDLTVILNFSLSPLLPTYTVISSPALQKSSSFPPYHRMTEEFPRSSKRIMCLAMLEPVFYL